MVDKGAKFKIQEKKYVRYYGMIYALYSKLNIVGIRICYRNEGTVISIALVVRSFSPIAKLAVKNKAQNMYFFYQNSLINKEIILYQYDSIYDRSEKKREKRVNTVFHFFYYNYALKIMDTVYKLS